MELQPRKTNQKWFRSILLLSLSLPTYNSLTYPQGIKISKSSCPKKDWKSFQQLKICEYANTACLKNLNRSLTTLIKIEVNKGHSRNFHKHVNNLKTSQILLLKLSKSITER